MVWVFAVVILSLMIFIPSLRGVALGLVVSVVVLGLIWYWFSKGQEQTTRNKIDLTELEFTDLRLDSAKHTLKGRIKNKSKRYTLTGLGIKIILQDCGPQRANGKTECETVGQTEERIHLDIPPQELRDIAESVSLPADSSISGSPSWSYLVQYIEGK
ncbi:MAG: hypothetical protein AB1898_09010 [Acidobacteriota bacterium]